MQAEASLWMSSEILQKLAREMSRKLSLPVLTAKHCCVRLMKGALLDATSSSSTALMSASTLAKTGWDALLATCMSNGTLK